MNESHQNADAIRQALERNDRVVSLRPAVGRGTAKTTASWRGGLSCEISEGPWRFAVGMTDKYGGANEAPNPGVYGRAALGSCLVLGYAMWAARMNVPIRSLNVEVQADYDASGELGLNPEVRPGYLAMRYVVRVESDASQDDVLRMLEVAERHSSFLDDYSNPVPVERTVEFIAPVQG